jgi:hypothetical protein
MSFAKNLRFCVCLALFAAGTSFGTEKLTQEQQEVKMFIEKLYSYDPMTFSGGYFDHKTGKPFIRNRVPQNYKQLKFDPGRQCDLLREFFDESTINKDSRPGAVICDADYLYPNLDDENRSSVTRYIEIPAPKIEVPVVNGNIAKVSVLTKGEEIMPGRNIFFLRKTDNGWRVGNVMTQSRLPKPTDERDECYYTFAKKPSLEEFKEVAAPCRQTLPAEYRP